MKDLNRYIEHTNLKPDVSQKDIEKIIEEGYTYQFAGICIPPFWVKKARRDMQQGDVQLVTVAGFPLGYNMTESKIAEIQKAIEDGADEVDIVWNLSAFRSGMGWVKNDIARCAELLHDHDKVLKVIIETAFLTEEEIIQACQICRDAGSDFVKTSTGFAHAGAMVSHVKLMRENLPSSIGIKAAGGIRDLDSAVAMITAGADRIGTSSGVKILEDFKSRPPRG